MMKAGLGLAMGANEESSGAFERGIVLLRSRSSLNRFLSFLGPNDLSVTHHRDRSFPSPSLTCSILGMPATPLVLPAVALYDI